MILRGGDGGSEVAEEELWGCGSIGLGMGEE